MDELATVMGLDTKELDKFLQEYVASHGQRIRSVNKALEEESVRMSMRSKFDDWKEPTPDEPDDFFGTGKTHNPPE